MIFGLLKHFGKRRQKEPYDCAVHFFPGEDASEYCPVGNLSRSSGYEDYGNQISTHSVILSRDSVYKDEEGRKHRVIIHAITVNAEDEGPDWEDEFSRKKGRKGFPFVQHVKVTDVLTGKVGWFEFSDIFEITELDQRGRPTFWTRDRGSNAAYLRNLVGAPHKTDREVIKNIEQTRARMRVQHDRKERIAAWGDGQDKPQARLFKPGIDAKITTIDGSVWSGNITRATFYNKLATLSGQFRKARKRNEESIEFTLDGYCETDNRIASIVIDGNLIDDLDGWVRQFVENRAKAKRKRPGQEKENLGEG